MLACSLANSVLVSASIRPISASVPTTTGRLNVTSSVVFLTLARPRFQPNRPLHHACRPRGQASARLINPRPASHLPQVLDTPIRYFLSSCPDGPAVLGQAIRSHWAIENTLHWVLDVTFREDDSRVRDRTAARNLALLRKIALNIVGRGKTSKASVRARRKKAAWNDAYMLKLLAG